MFLPAKQGSICLKLCQHCGVRDTTFPGLIAPPLPSLKPPPPCPNWSLCFYPISLNRVAKQIRLKLILAHVIPLLKTLQGLFISFKVKAKILTTPFKILHNLKLFTTQPSSPQRFPSKLIYQSSSYSFHSTHTALLAVPQTQILEVEVGCQTRALPIPYTKYALPPDNLNASLLHTSGLYSNIPFQRDTFPDNAV